MKAYKKHIAMCTVLAVSALLIYVNLIMPSVLVNNAYYEKEIRKELGLKEPLLIVDVAEIGDSHIVAYIESESTGSERASYSVFKKNTDQTYDLYYVTRKSMTRRAQDIFVEYPPLQKEYDTHTASYMIVLSLNPDLHKIEYIVIGESYEVVKEVTSNPSMTLMELYSTPGDRVVNAEYHFYDQDGNIIK